MNHLTRLSWVCDTCGFPIADGQGVLCVPFLEINNPPDMGGRWRAQHTSCANREHVDYYGIDIESVSDALGLVWWSAHLIGKNWLPETNWEQVLRFAHEQLRKVGA